MKQLFLRILSYSQENTWGKKGLDTDISGEYREIFEELEAASKGVL